MYSVTNTATVLGLEAHMVAVEVDMSEGLPVIEMVGLLDAEVKESKERVRAALKNCGYSMPVKRITINFSPANIRKSGSGFDLPLAIAFLANMGLVSSENFEDITFLGELSLDGKVMPINGVLPMVICAKKAGKKFAVVPAVNYKEAALVSDISIVPVNSLEDACEFLNEGTYTLPDKELSLMPANKKPLNDFAMVNGQKPLRRACEVAISGMHNMLMIGPPGAGKSMIAKCIPSILPDMTIDEQLQLSMIYSVCGKFTDTGELIRERPFRSPHHTITEQGLIGGGLNPHPGEISLANNGVLFLDELTEFKKQTLEVLRQPLEDKCITITRTSGNFVYPANFVLIAAMNPCKCGYYPDLSRCSCTQKSINSYLGKISQPLLDRIDICTEAKAIGYKDIRENRENESSAEIKKRVVACQEIQKKRYREYNFDYNSHIPSDLIDTFCHLDKKEASLMEDMYNAYNLTARTYHKVLKVARTIADMAGEEKISAEHLTEAMCYRGLDKRYFKGAY